MKKGVIIVIIFCILSCEVRDQYIDFNFPDLQIDDALTDASFNNPDLFKPAFHNCIKINTQLSENNDNTDIYIPNAEVIDKKFYLIVILQGSDLSKKNYSIVSNMICRYGFIVAIPDHFKESFTGRHLYSEQNATNEIVNKIFSLSKQRDSTMYSMLDDSKFILLGHSYGAGCGLFMINNECRSPFCTTEYTRPDDLSGGIFFGVSLKYPFGDWYFDIDNNRIPIMLIAGDNDGAVKYDYAKETFVHILSPPKIFITIIGANHYAINDSNPPAGADADKNKSKIDQNLSLEIISELTVSFINGFILRDERWKAYLLDNLTSKYKEYIAVENTLLEN